MNLYEFDRQINVLLMDQCLSIGMPLGYTLRAPTVVGSYTFTPRWVARRRLIWKTNWTFGPR